MSELKHLPFTIIGFPCNQFHHKEPGMNEAEILNSLYYVRPGNKFTPSFPLMSKIDVNGNKEHPLYSYLKKSCDVPSATVHWKTESFWDPIKVNDIGWNFEKFLIDRSGYPAFRFKPEIEPKQLLGIINIMLKEDMSRYETKRSILIELHRLEREMKIRFRM